jgi:hypothetical protein
MIPNDAATYLSASTEKAECTGFSWPCRLFEVEPLPEGSFRYYNAETGERAKLTPEGRPDGTETIRVVDLGRVLNGLGYPHKRAALAFRVVRELDAFEALGPNGEAVAHLTERIAACTVEEIKKLGAAWGAAWDAALSAAWGAAWDAALGAALDAALGAALDAAWGAALGAAWGAARGAARGAALAVLVKDKITPEQFDILTKPWRDAGLPL